MTGSIEGYTVAELKERLRYLKTERRMVISDLIGDEMKKGDLINNENYDLLMSLRKMNEDEIDRLAALLAEVAGE